MEILRHSQISATLHIYTRAPRSRGSCSQSLMAPMMAGSRRLPVDEPGHPLICATGRGSPASWYLDGSACRTSPGGATSHISCRITASSVRAWVRPVTAACRPTCVVRRRAGRARRRKTSGRTGVHRSERRATAQHQLPDPGLRADCVVGRAGRCDSPRPAAHSSESGRGGWCQCEGGATDEAFAARGADYLRTGTTDGGVIDLGKRRSPGR